MVKSKVSTGMTIARKPGIAATEVDGEMVMMDFAQNKYFGLNSVGTFIWNNIEEKTSIAELRELALTEFDISSQDCEREILSFVDKLLEASLIETTESA